MTDQNIGIKSLSYKIFELEQKLKTIEDAKTSNYNAFEDDLINTSLNAKQQFQKHELQKIKNHFLDNLKSKQIELHDDNAFNIIRHVILYVESNIKKIAMLVDSDVSGEFKLHIALSLIHDVLPETLLTSDFLKNSINTLVDVIFNESKKKIEVKQVDVDEIKIAPMIKYMEPPPQRITTKAKWRRVFSLLKNKNKKPI